MLLAVFDALALGGQCTQSRLVFRPLGIGHQVAPVDPVRVLVAPPLATLREGAGRHDAQQHARTRTFQSSWSSPVSPFIGADR